MSTARPRGGSIVLRMIVSLILLLIGLTAITALLSGNDPIQGGQLTPQSMAIYFSVAILCFAMVSFSVFRVRRGYSVSFWAPNKVMSVVRCAQCSFKQIKNFTVGDYVFKAVGQCSQCGSPNLFINAIYAEDTKKR